MRDELLELNANKKYFSFEYLFFLLQVRIILLNFIGLKMDIGYKVVIKILLFSVRNQEFLLLSQTGFIGK